MTDRGLKLSASSVSRARAGRANNSDTLARLQALDKNGDGQLDLDEVCDAIDEIVRKEKTERTLRWMLAALAIFSLLTIAATVGLTYAVVALSKDTQVDGSVLQSKDTGETLRTGSFLQSQNATSLLNAATTSNDPAAVLGRVSSIKVPSLKDGEAYTVHKVDAVTLLLNGSVVVRTSTGMDVLMPIDNLMGAGTEANTTTDTTQGGRKLLQESGGYKISIRQSTVFNLQEGRTYTFDVTGDTTISDIIANFKDSALVGDLAPSESLVELKKTPTTPILDGSVTLSSLGSPTTLYMNVRKVEYWVCSDDGKAVCEQYTRALYLPLGDTVAGVKREVEFDKTPPGKASAMPARALIVYKGAGENQQNLNKPNELVDTERLFLAPEDGSYTPYCEIFGFCFVKVKVDTRLLTTIQT